MGTNQVRRRHGFRGIITDHVAVLDAVYPQADGIHYGLVPAVWEVTFFRHVSH